MNTRFHRAAACVVASTALVLPAPAHASEAAYAKECGSCHMAYPAGLLPERSWRRLMGSLASHFGENAELKATERESITAYLAANAGDRVSTRRWRDIMASIPAADTPMRITSTPHIEGVHGGLLDPAFKGKPAVGKLTECAACHPKAASGDFGERRYVITDEMFRRPEK